MDLVMLISLLHAGTLSIAVLGFLMFISTPAYRGVCALLALVSATAIANVFEDLHILRDQYLISPIFVLGYGPALYFTVKRLVVGPVGFNAMWHFLPMLFLLPFTAHVQGVIALGTFWRIVYAILTLKLIVEFNRQLTTRRSDAAEVSLTWLGWLIVVSTVFSALDLLRLNIQIELGQHLNMIGYAISSFIFFIVLLLLILILNSRRAGLQAVADLGMDELSTIAKDVKDSVETAADYQSLFEILDKEIRTQEWYCQPRLTLNQLSALSGMATRDISRCINLVGGMSFNDYINQHRIEKIKRALQARDNNSPHLNFNVNLTDLAFAAGFSSKATFNQSFKKATGMTPSEYRSLQHVQNQESSRLVSRD